jgi:RNA polymerase sigma factor (sigma-70 family)
MSPSAQQRHDQRLVRAARRGDAVARRQLVETYLPPVRRVASGYRNLGLPTDDLVQEGALGLLDAIQRFDARRDRDFATFARWRIRRAILDALTTRGRLVRLPKQVVERRRALAHASDELTAVNGHAPSVLDLATATGLPTHVVEGATRVPTAPVSLDAPIGGTTTLEGVVTDPSARDPEAEAEAHEETRLVRRAVRRLPNRQRYVVARHFGLGCDAAPLTRIAHDLHVSPQRARAIERAALHDLADELGPPLGRDARR